MTDLTTPTTPLLELLDGEADFLIEAIRTERTKLLEELAAGPPEEEYESLYVVAFGTACRLLEKLGACPSFGCEAASHPSSEPHLCV